MSTDNIVLRAAKAIAQRQQRNLGDVVSELARRSAAAPRPARCSGIPQLPGRTGQPVVTLDIVDAQRDELP